MAAVLSPYGQRVSLFWFWLWRKLCGIFVSLGLSFYGALHFRAHTMPQPTLSVTLLYFLPEHKMCFMATLVGILQGFCFYYCCDKWQKDIVMVLFQPTRGLMHNFIVELQYMSTVLLSSCTALFCEPNVKFGMKSYSFGNSRIPLW